ncbi:SDR family NAD(P)-dependent oxidoreductase [Ruminococcus flavefaciens]|uniref:SDR family NAD(P)-dependent oxidoreductase n=1 Tax=Ruminococcus flavefaciens TaxID=1265 RepID=UPI00048F003A|nr:SDR family NAD(P)-dependent oxidoreductase [Ruminococcus flavefaciens]
MASIAIITGATGGLGQEFVREVLKEQVDEIWTVARNQEKLDKLKKQFGDKVRAVKCDLSKADDLAALKELINAEKSDIRLLINNAGMGDMGESCEFSDEYISKTVDLNCKAVCLLCNYAIPFMSKGARILNISSASSFQPVPYINLYAASKVFVRSYTRSLNVELKSKGIICTAVCPGWIDTDMLSKEYKGKPVKFPGLVSPNRVAVQALRDSAKGKDMSVCTLFVKYEHLLSKILPQKLLMKIWMYGIRDYV